MDTQQAAQIALYGALAKAQGEFKPIQKNRSVQIRSSKGNYSFDYADLEEILSKTRPALAANGLSVIQPLNQDAAGTHLDTILMHKDGGMISSRMTIPRAGGDIKEFGGVVTYIKRYALTAMLCVAADDDLDENGQEAGAEPVQGQRRATPANDNAPQGDPAELPEYPANKFAVNIMSWKAAVHGGRTTPQRIITMIESKNTLTEQQRTEILALASADAQEGAAE